MRAQPRPRRARRWLGAALLAVLIGLVGVGATAVLSGRYQVHPVLSGSMRPGLPVGGVVITERVPTSSLRVRDVVVFHRPGQPQELVVHRIVSLTPGPSGPVVQTQGDTNNIQDPWKVTLSGTTAYRAIYSLPLIGYVAVWAHSPAGRRTFMLLGLLLVAGALFSGRIIRRMSAHRSASRKEDSVQDSGAVDDHSDAVSDVRRPRHREREPEREAAGADSSGLTDIEVVHALELRS